MRSFTGAEDMKMMRKQYSSLQATAGFTLIEVLVVMILMGTIAAIAAPGWLGFLNRQRMNAARTDLMGVLRAAQEEAQSRQQSKQVEFSTSKLSVTVRNNFTSTGVVATTGGIVTKLGNSEANAKFNLVTSSASLVFDQNGRVPASVFPFAIKITQDDSSAQSCVIVTTLLGGLKPANDDTCDSFDPTPVNPTPVQP